MGKNAKATFVLPEEILADMREAVRSGTAESASALVRDALAARLRELKEERLSRIFQDAAMDPDFLADLRETMDAFQAADAETGGLIPD